MTAEENSSAAATARDSVGEGCLWRCAASNAGSAETGTVPSGACGVDGSKVRSEGFELVLGQHHFKRCRRTLEMGFSWSGKKMPRLKSKIYLL